MRFHAPLRIPKHHISKPVRYSILGLALTVPTVVAAVVPATGSRRVSLSDAEILYNGARVPFPSRNWNAWKGKFGPSTLRRFVCAQVLVMIALLAQF